MEEKNNQNLPCFTDEELNFFRQKDAFYKKHRIGTPLKKIISRSLQEMAVKKLLGFAGFEKNKEEAIKHHLKACKYDPCLINSRPKFRKEAGLL